MIKPKMNQVENAKLFGISLAGLIFGCALGTARANLSPDAGRSFTCFTTSSTIAILSICLALVSPIVGAFFLPRASRKTRMAIRFTVFIIVTLPGVFLYHEVSSRHCSPWL
jgi:ABC-type Fe3+ transport system permease subunit